ncbi:MAG: hypothetical protein IKR13_01095 [Victivallales bacterium]|nr:hypothetical protein [Victivallales bacterium]
MRILAWFLLLSVMVMFCLECIGYCMMGMASNIPGAWIFLVMPYPWWRWLRGMEDGKNNKTLRAIGKLETRSDELV